MLYDIIIIGGGPAGLTAAIYSGRAALKTLLISEAVPGGQAMLTEEIENYPGFQTAVQGPELINNMYEQAKKLDIEFKTLEAQSVIKDKNGFIVKTAEGDKKALSVIIATGASYKKLGVPGEEEFTGKGVSYCGVCDGPLFRDKDIAVVGGGDTALYEAAHLLKFAAKVHLVHRRDRLRAAKVMQAKVLGDKKTVPHWNSTVEEILGSKLVEGIRLADARTGKTKDIAVKGVFVFVGITPGSKIVSGLVKTDAGGYIITDENMASSERGVFAAGDVRKKTLRQISTAVGEGAAAAFSAQQYAEELKGIAYK